MSPSLLRSSYLVLFPTSILFVRALAVFGADPLTLAQLSPIGCPFYRLFHWVCPTCGLTRSVLLAWNGNFDLSLRYHFGGIVLLLIGVIYYILLATDSHRSVLTYFRNLTTWTRYRFLFGVAIFLYSFWGFFLRTNI